MLWQRLNLNFVIIRNVYQNLRLRSFFCIVLSVPSSSFTNFDCNANTVFWHISPKCYSFIKFLLSCFLMDFAFFVLRFRLASYYLFRKSLKISIHSWNLNHMIFHCFRAGLSKMSIIRLLMFIKSFSHLMAVSCNHFMYRFS